MKIGVVGTSRYCINLKDAKEKIIDALNSIIGKSDHSDLEKIQIVSGSGAIPYTVYQYCQEKGYDYIWFTSEIAANGKLAKKSVSDKIIIGKNYGDESESFVKYIDALIRIGGGPQSHNEVQLMRKNKPDALIEERDIEFKEKT